jgi:hypothetical protein
VSFATSWSPMALSTATKNDGCFTVYLMSKALTLMRLSIRLSNRPWSMLWSPLHSPLNGILVVGTPNYPSGIPNMHTIHDPMINVLWIHIYELIIELHHPFDTKYYNYNWSHDQVWYCLTKIFYKIVLVKISRKGETLFIS